MSGLRLLITRPREDAEPLAARLQASGHETILEPLLEISYRENELTDLNGVSAILATSANGVRAFSRAFPRRDLPLYAVGPATARVANENGFDRVIAAAGDVQALAATVAKHVNPADGRLLHVAGTRVAGDLQGALADQGYQMDRAVLYDAKTADRLSEAASDALKTGAVDGVLFFSPRTARTFVSLAIAGGLGPACRAVTAYCLSPAVADGATEQAEGLAWGQIRVAARPEEASILDLIETE